MQQLRIQTSQLTVLNSCTSKWNVNVVFFSIHWRNLPQIQWLPPPPPKEILDILNLIAKCGNVIVCLYFAMHLKLYSKSESKIAHKMDCGPNWCPTLVLNFIEALQIFSKISVQNIDRSKRYLNIIKTFISDWNKWPVTELFLKSASYI